MAVENIQFQNDQINLATGTGISGKTTLSGTLTVDYGGQSVTGQLQDTNGNTYTNFTLQNSGGNYVLMSSSRTGVEGPLTYSIEVDFPNTNMAPSSVSTISRSVAGNTSARTDNVAVTSTMACYVEGTRIRTPHGDVAVETLRVGDLVVTASGDQRPILWLGHREVRCRNRHDRAGVLPIRISAHAFGDHRPARDLSVSPGHALCVDVLGEVLIPASALINGTTVVQEDVDQVTYWHVELDSHDILLAENMPAESYLAMGNRDFFVEADVVDLAASPDTPVSHADLCRPFHAGGAIVEAVRALLAARARRLGRPLDGSCDLQKALVA